jgi:hypothetical protein
VGGLAVGLQRETAGGGQWVTRVRLAAWHKNRQSKRWSMLCPSSICACMRLARTPGESTCFTAVHRVDCASEGVPGQVLWLTEPHTGRVHVPHAKPKMQAHVRERPPLHRTALCVACASRQSITTPMLASSLPPPPSPPLPPHLPLEWHAHQHGLDRCRAAGVLAAPAARFETTWLLGYSGAV